MATTFSDESCSPEGAWKRRAPCGPIEFCPLVTGISRGNVCVSVCVCAVRERGEGGMQNAGLLLRRKINLPLLRLPAWGIAAPNGKKQWPHVGKHAFFLQHVATSTRTTRTTVLSISQHSTYTNDTLKEFVSFWGTVACFRILIVFPFRVYVFQLAGCSCF